jgi:hypothetical protein
VPWHAPAHWAMPVRCARARAGSRAGPAPASHGGGWLWRTRSARPGPTQASPPTSTVEPTPAIPACAGMQDRGRRRAGRGTRLEGGIEAGAGRGRRGVDALQRALHGADDGPVRTRQRPQRVLGVERRRRLEGERPPVGRRQVRHAVQHPHRRPVDLAQPVQALQQVRPDEPCRPRPESRRRRQPTIAGIIRSEPPSAVQGLSWRVQPPQERGGPRRRGAAPIIALAEAGRTGPRGRLGGRAGGAERVTGVGNAAEDVEDDVVLAHALGQEQHLRHRR